ncbi:hypothetical protein EYF80_044108 [Liparis tanakae]|uniref:Up-regulator of cell proliferation-like domain-containing protein n=1 Tax=Liparis tanakae TaxID=230148 RepID=A0A4Z2FWR7_9TELE|nr:hypothetical protein EYF80_044108 [Liparis tanakae]
MLQTSLTAKLPTCSGTISPLEPPKDNAQEEVLKKLGLEAFRTTPLDTASMLDISTWTLENRTPLEPKDLPKAFLQHLWLLSPDARSPCCKPLHDNLNNGNKSPEEIIDGIGEESQGMDGGQLPRRLSNGLVEIGWYLPTGDTARDIFPVPVSSNAAYLKNSAGLEC